MKFSLLLVLRQYRRAPLRSAFLFGGMLCAVGLICGTMFGAASLNHGIILSADSAAAPLIHRAAQLLTLLVAFFAGLLLKNSFLITLQQRMQMLGRLCALGMPRRQMGWMLLWEALLGMGAAFLAQIMRYPLETIQNAAEIALEHHLGMTCDPVGGYVQIPCIERNAMSAVKAYTAYLIASSLPPGMHRVSLDEAITAMAETGRDMNAKYKETALGGLALSVPQC